MRRENLSGPLLSLTLGPSSPHPCPRMEERVPDQKAHCPQVPSVHLGRGQGPRSQLLYLFSHVAKIELSCGSMASLNTISNTSYDHNTHSCLLLSVKTGSLEVTSKDPGARLPRFRGRVCCILKADFSDPQFPHL